MRVVSRCRSMSAANANAELSDFWRVCVGNRTILLQMKFCVGASAPLGYRLRGRPRSGAGSAGWRLMASKTEESPQKEEMPEKEGPEALPESPLFDLSDAAVKKL